MRHEPSSMSSAWEAIRWYTHSTHHGSRSTAISWYECGNTGKVLQRCVMDLLQWVWFDKPSNKLIQSTMGVDRLPHLDMNVETLERFYKDTSNLLQWVWFDKPSDELIQSTIWLFGCLVVVSSLDQSNRRKETCHHYIWKIQLDKSSFWIERND